MREFQPTKFNPESLCHLYYGTVSVRELHTDIVVNTFAAAKVLAIIHCAVIAPQATRPPLFPSGSLT